MMDRAFYFGCWDRPGHFLHDTNGRTVYDKPDGFPWPSINWLDGSLLQNGKIADEPDGNVYWTCGGARSAPDMWFAFYWWDRSVDRRGACNSGFYVKRSKPDPLNPASARAAAVDAFAFACGQFPTIVQRQRFPLSLQIVRGN